MPVKSFSKNEPLTDAGLDLGDFPKGCKGGRAMNVTRPRAAVERRLWRSSR